MSLCLYLYSPIPVILYSCIRIQSYLYMTVCVCVCVAYLESNLELYLESYLGSYLESYLESSLQFELRAPTSKDVRPSSQQEYAASLAEAPAYCNSGKFLRLFLRMKKPSAMLWRRISCPYIPRGVNSSLTQLDDQSCVFKKLPQRH